MAFRAALVALAFCVLAVPRQGHAWTSQTPAVAAGIHSSRPFGRQIQVLAKAGNSKSKSSSGAASAKSDEVSKLKALLREKEADNERLSQQVAAYKKEMGAMMVKQHEAKLEVAQESSRLEARVSVYQKEMASMVVKQHAAQLRLVREKERLASSIATYEKEMAKLLVKQHEARLQAVAAVESALKQQIAAVEQALRSEQETSRQLRAELQDVIINLGKSKVNAVKEMQDQLDAMKDELGERNSEVELMTDTLRNVMVKSHEARLEKSDQDKMEKKALEDLIQDLNKELEEIKEARDEYIRERELVLETIGDA